MVLRRDYWPPGPVIWPDLPARRMSWPERSSPSPPTGRWSILFVQAHRDETTAFLHIAQSQPHHVVLLIDTYDTEAAAERVVMLAPELKRQGIAIHGVRLDSGDLGAHARKVRHILDRGGLEETTILASGNLDEERIEALVTSGAPIDRFAVGTAMTTSPTRPTWTAPINSRNMPGDHAGSVQRVKPPGPAGNRSIDGWDQMDD